MSLWAGTQFISPTSIPLLDIGNRAQYLNQVLFLHRDVRICVPDDRMVLLQLPCVSDDAHHSGALSRSKRNTNWIISVRLSRMSLDPHVNRSQSFLWWAASHQRFLLNWYLLSGNALQVGLPGSLQLGVELSSLKVACVWKKQWLLTSNSNVYLNGYHVTFISHDNKSYYEPSKIERKQRLYSLEPHSTSLCASSIQLNGGCDGQRIGRCHTKKTKTNKKP